LKSKDGHSCPMRKSNKHVFNHPDSNFLSFSGQSSRNIAKVPVYTHKNDVITYRYRNKYYIYFPTKYNFKLNLNQRLLL